MLLGALQTVIRCPYCPQPIHLEVPVEAYRSDTTTSGVVMQVDSVALRTAVRIHLRQHEDDE